MMEDNPFLGLFFNTSQESTAMTTIVPHIDTFHLDGNHKHEENSHRGAQRAKAEGKEAIDIDNRHGRSRRSYACHWAQPLAHDGFRDPEHKIPLHARLNTLSDNEIDRLRTPDHYRIWSSTNMVNYSTNLGLLVKFEMKEYYSVPELIALHASFDHPDRVILEALATFPGAYKWLENGRRAGFDKTLILWHRDERNHPIPESAKHYIKWQEPGVIWIKGR